MIEIKTRFGTFEVDESEYTLNDTGEGVNIRLRFVPGPDIDARKLGMVQIANSIVDGAPESVNGNPVVRHHSIPAGEPGAGFHIDQDPANRNPIYVVNAHPPGSDDLAAGQELAFFGAFGWYYREDDGRISESPALLRDMTRIVGARAGTGQRFETTCLAVAGAQTGMYYGSVSWGWEIDGEGNARLLPVELVSPDTPSAVFLRAAEIWNRSETAGGEPTIPLPISTPTQPDLSPQPELQVSGLTPEQLEELVALLRNLMTSESPAPLAPARSRTKADESTILRFYQRAERWDKPKLPFSLSQFTLTTTPLGLGDTVMLTDLPRSAARAGRSVMVHSPSPFFSALMRYNPHYSEGRLPFWVAADALRFHFDLGNGHFIQRLQRAFGLEPDVLPRGCIEVPGATRRPGQVALHLEPGPHVAWQREHLHPRARAVYPENLEILQRFIDLHRELDFVEVGLSPSGLRGVEDGTSARLEDTIERMAGCEYFLGIISGPMHIAAALGLKMIGIINFPDPAQIYLPVLKEVSIVESSWFYPQSVLLHQDGEGELVARFSLSNLERAIAGELYPYWSDDYLPLIHERL